MHRFYLPPENCRSQLLRLEGREAYHALRVLRLKRGDLITILDGTGQSYLCGVENTVKDSLILALLETKSQPLPPCAITLLAGIPRGKVMEDIIQKAVELGAGHIVPLQTDRVVAHIPASGAEARREKWQLVAIEAIKQCGAAWLPTVDKPQTIADFLKRGLKSELSLVGSLQSQRRHPHECILEFQEQHRRLPRTVAIWIGPEGDFTAPELETIEASGAKAITLGNLTLRVETAAVYCLSFLNYELTGGVKSFGGGR